MTIQEIEELLMLAKKAMNECTFAEAESLSRQCIEKLILHNGHPQPVVVAYRILADSYLKRGMLQQALEHAEKALSISDNCENVEERAQILNLLGLVCLEFMDLERALLYFTDAMNMFITSNNHYIKTICKHNIAIVYFKQSNYSQALKYYHEVLIENCINNDQKLIGQIKNNIAIVYHVQAEYHHAIHWYLEAVSIYRNYNIKSELGNSLANLGCAYRDISNNEKALFNYREAMEVFEDLDMRNALAQCLGNIGVTYRNLTDYPRAIEYLKKSVIMLEELGAVGEAALFAGNIGITYSQMGDHVQSLEYLINAYDTHKKLHQEVESALFASNIGFEYYHINEYEQALRYTYESLPILQNSGRKEEATGSYRTIGYVYASAQYSVNDYKKAEKILLEVVETYTNLGAKLYLCQTHEFLATFYKQQSRWEEYVEHIEKYHQLYIEIQNDEVKKQADRFGWERKIVGLEKQKEVEGVKNEADKKILEETINFQKLSLEQQSRELKNTIEDLIRKNTLLQRILTDIKRITPYTVREGSEHIKQLTDRVERNITPFESNKQLRNQVNEIHKDFICALRQRFPDLTTMELKVASLLSMKFTSSYIAAALCLSKRTVESHRLSLRKKCGLGKDDDIYVELSKYMM